MSRRFAHVEAARNEAERLGASFRWVHDGGKITGYIELNGKSRKLFMSVTPSDVRVAKNIQKNVRDYIKEMS